MSFALSCHAVRPVGGSASENRESKIPKPHTIRYGAQQVGMTNG